MDCEDWPDGAPPTTAEEDLWEDSLLTVSWHPALSLAASAPPPTVLQPPDRVGGA